MQDLINPSWNDTHIRQDLNRVVCHKTRSTIHTRALKMFIHDPHFYKRHHWIKHCETWTGNLRSPHHNKLGYCQKRFLQHAALFQDAGKRNNLLTTSWFRKGKTEEEKANLTTAVQHSHTKISTDGLPKTWDIAEYKQGCAFKYICIFRFSLLIQPMKGQQNAATNNENTKRKP